jgi:DNA-binding LytR/AlgR family response regulator
MEKIKVLIVEDMLMIAEDIAFRLTKNEMEVVGTCSSGEEAIDMAQKKRPDLILMDIGLSGEIDGITTAQRIHAQQFIPIIYLSDYTDSNTLGRAKKTLPANYLAKPFNEPDLIRAIDIAFTNARHMPSEHNRFKDQVFLRTNNQAFVKLDVKDILYLEADRAYCNIMTTSKEYKLSTSMNHVFEQFAHEDFIKVHRSYIVNIKQITALDGNVIHFGEKEVTMSKEYRDDLIRLLKIIK